MIAAWSDFDLKNDHNVEDYEIFKNCSNHEYLLSINSDCCFYPEEQEELNNAHKKQKSIVSIL